MITLEDIRESIVRGRSREIEIRIHEALEQGIKPEDIVNKALLPAVQQVGAEHQGEADIPLILCAARGMTRGLDILEPLLGEKREDYYLGTVILGTIEGDLHDLGKNLVGIMFRASGLQVVDLGVDVSSKQFLKAIREHPEAQIVSISSLLSTSLPEVKRLVAAIRRADKKHFRKIMIGGGAVTAEFAAEIGADAYTDNAMEAAKMARHLLGYDN